MLNLLSIGAAYGVVVAVFQWGWGRSLLGVSENVPIESYVPMMMFAIVFGLSMDYEVFLLSRVQGGLRPHRRQHPSGRAPGLAATAPGHHLRRADHDQRVRGVRRLAPRSSSRCSPSASRSSVLIDASVVRLLLVPATMTLFGRRRGGCPAGSTGCCRT